ncbi:MAG: hypothetical protein EON54_05210 [Alcaligenaceae bacterium]|nr:MAG: hypothetical protein EON54_05210 [Alcaligenaceae bacterium]
MNDATGNEKVHRRYKHTGSMVPDFVFSEWYDRKNRILTISADEFDSVAVTELVIQNNYGMVAHEDETRPSALPSASVILEISGVRFRAWIVRQRRHGVCGGEQLTVRLIKM